MILLSMHSYYSLMWGTASPAQICRAAKEMGYVSNRQRPEMIAAQTRAKAQLTEKLQTVKGLKELIVFVKDHKEALSV